MTPKLFALAPIPVLLASCSTLVSVNVPSSRIPDFEKCVANPSITYAAPAHSLAADALWGADFGQVGESRDHPAPLVTAPPASFRNMYKELAARTHGADQGQNDARAAAVERVRSLLQDPKVQGRINQLYNQLSSASDEGELDLGTSDIKNYTQAVAKSTSLGDWSAYANSSIYSFAMSANAHRTPEGVDFASPDVRQNLNNMAIAIYIHFKAYFRNGQFVQGSVSLAGLQSAFPALAKLPAALQTQLQDIINSIQRDATFGKVGTAGFVTRGGDMLQVPGINITFDPTKPQVSVTKIDYASVGADLVRVLLEAIFDAHDRIPAVSNATGVVDVAAEPGMASVGLVDFGKITQWSPSYTAITSTQFGDIQSFANSLDSATAAGTGQLIRGLGPTAMNNDALAKVIESAVGTTVRKVGEKLAWCWYATTPAAKRAQSPELSGQRVPDALVARMSADDGPESGDDPRQVKIRIRYGVFGP